MRLIALIAASIVLAGCSTTAPVVMKFPNVPAELTVPCPELQKVPVGTEELSKVLGVVTKNYAQYHECSAKFEAWIEWHSTQKKIYESLK
jgi:hypothetical protein